MITQQPLCSPLFRSILSIYIFTGVQDSSPLACARQTSANTCELCSATAERSGLSPFISPLAQPGTVRLVSRSQRWPLPSHSCRLPNEAKWGVRRVCASALMAHGVRRSLAAPVSLCHRFGCGAWRSAEVLACAEMCSVAACGVARAAGVGCLSG